MTVEELTRRLEAYLALRIALGFAMRIERYVLEDYVRFVATHGGSGPIRARTAVEWACRGSATQRRAGQAQRLSVVRGFLRHLRATEPDTEVPDWGILGTRLRRSKPYLFSEADIVRMMDAARRLRPRDSLRPRAYSTLIGLLATTGLRIGEAFKLTVADVMLDVELPRLHIVDSKFGKSRWVPVHSSTASMLGQYAQERARLRFDALTDIFFPSEAGTPIAPSVAWRSFRRLADLLDLKPDDGSRRPTWHSFRHTFAVRRLTEWCEQGEDVAALVPNLSVYLGHLRPEETYWYLTATPALLRAASRSFERFAEPGGDA